MYSNKENVNILTSLLREHGIRYAVCCPGSRNSPIVHNLNECPDIACYPVTDERSAGFYALGMSQCLKEPVVVCVTSGTALLNLAPAVAEAYYQHIPLVVISADRPQAWIDQLDGQTLPQPDALGRFVKKAVSLPEVISSPPELGKATGRRALLGNGVRGGLNEPHWYCNRLVNEALLEKHAPVHINVPISEPLFDYNVAELPVERKIELLPADITNQTLSHVCRMFMQSERPLLVAGQPMNPGYDEAVCLIGDDESYVPDLVLYIGGSIVSKRLKRFLRKAKETWVVNATGEVTDTFMNLTRVIQGDVAVVEDQIRFLLEQQSHPFVQKWETLLSKVRAHAAAYQPDYSEMAVVKCFETQITIHSSLFTIHYANSTAIRLANIFAQHSVYCNRGVNGIEGSLSTAAGFSVVTEDNVFCVIGDLSFFYDQNALWNQNLRGNFRILLLNNGKGGIFNLLRGLEQSPARDKYVAAEHHTSAEGICQQNDIVYLKAENMEQLQQGVSTLLNINSSRPVLLEVFTDPAEDERVFKDYYKTLRI
jgi:2-succinyl-5-enolpyruvyl-6-hydroxy-3-cyclohexene-1-carboxylate synthase